MSQARARLREAVTRNKEQKLTALLHHVTVDVLRAGFLSLMRSAAPGVDDLTWDRYAEDLEANLVDLHARVHAGMYRALPSRCRYVSKADGGQRPLSIAALEDKIVQADAGLPETFRQATEERRGRYRGDLRGGAARRPWVSWWSRAKPPKLRRSSFGRAISWSDGGLRSSTPFVVISPSTESPLRKGRPRSASS